MNHSKSLYIHIPFCLSVCDYCDFVKVPYHQALSDQVLERIIEDLSDHQRPFKTIYVGGGTPSALSEAQLERFLSALKPMLTTQQEFTIEINPETVSYNKLALMKSHGVNRLSIGVQAVQDHLLKRLTRQHSWQDAQHAIDMMRKLGFDNISVDAMYGIPGQTLDDFKETLLAFIQLNVEHISLYALTIEPNTPFYRQQVKPVDNELEGQFFDLAHELLTHANYDHYEVSSFSKATKKSQHNLAYWYYDDFIGIGPGAASKSNNIRQTNTSNLHHYLKKENLIKEVVELSKNESMFEKIMMGLRLSKGIDIVSFNIFYDVDFYERYYDAIKQAKRNGWVETSEKRIKTTYTGRLFLHDVLLLFMDDKYNHDKLQPLTQT